MGETGVGSHRKAVMFDSFNSFLEIYRIGDYAGLLGLVISFVGFFITYQAAAKSKTASEMAAAAVAGLHIDIKRSEIVESFATALAVMDEIRRMYLSDNMFYLPERCNSLRSHLIAIRAGSTFLTHDDLIVLQSAITRSSSMEKAVIDYLVKSVPVERDRLTRAISKDYDALQTVFVRIRNDIGSGNLNGG